MSLSFCDRTSSVVSRPRRNVHLMDRGSWGWGGGDHLILLEQYLTGCCTSHSVAGLLCHLRPRGIVHLIDGGSGGGVWLADFIRTVFDKLLQVKGECNLKAYWTLVEWAPPFWIYRRLALCRLRVSRYYHLCRSDFSFPTFFPYILLHFTSVYVENG